MEAVFIYLLKSSGLIAAFFLAYHFLLRKETFFNSNRWFLLAGLITSAVLPLFFIKKIVYVEKPKISLEDLVAITNQSNTSAIVPPQAATPFDWVQMVTVVYVLIVCFLLLKVLVNVVSLFKLLNNKPVDKEETFSLVDLQENIAPFSFFNFIVFNSSLYSQHELESILLHEKVHSQERHSYDVLIAKIFSILFWFNPFVWLYKKAIVQNLEYIADHKAIQQIEDKKVYQKALLKVVTHQNCLPITNHFYQSLIKKRIVMLNKNQSHKRNSWKYGIVVPALIAFVFLFQIKTIAQERETEMTRNRKQTDAIYITTNKNTTDEQMKKQAAMLKEKYDVTLKFSKIKRNDKGEITRIKLEYKDKNGNTGVTQFDGKEPIKPIHFYKKDDKIGFGNAREARVYAVSTNDKDNEYVVNINKEVEDAIAAEAPEVPEAPEAPEAPKLIELDDLDVQLETLAPLGAGSNNRIMIQNDGEEPMVIVNGQVIKGGELSKDVLKKLKGYTYTYSSDDDGEIIINGKNIAKIRTQAGEDARIQLKRLRPEIKRSMEKARVEMERVRPLLQKSRQDMERSRPDMEKAKAEMEQAKEEMVKAKIEMEKMKAEMEKMKADLKRQKK